MIQGARVFGIGFNKTGTSSLRQCFGILGFEPVAPLVHESNVLAAAQTALIRSEDYEPALRFAEGFRAFKDRPWNMWQMHRHLDERFPGSRFVLTVRDPEAWWRSVQHWTSVVRPNVATTYRAHLRIDRLDREPAIAAYLEYNDQVRRHFAGREQDLLVVDFSAGAGWPELCEFFGVPVPDLPFPHRNRQSYDRSDRKRWAAIGTEQTRQRREQRLRAATSGEKCNACGHPIAFRTPTPTSLRRRLPAPVRRHSAIHCSDSCVTRIR